MDRRGLIEKFCEGNNRYEDMARDYFTRLRFTFFFQESSSGGSKFVMHDLVHDLALEVSKGSCVDFSNVNVHSRRLSYLQGKDESQLNNMSRTKLRRLRTFLTFTENRSSRGGNFFLKKKLLGEWLSNFKLLRVLSLKGHDIFTLPKSVGEMMLLRYLDLSNTNIDRLPRKICTLYSLQILLLYGCQELKKLPAEICNLVNLRHLNIAYSGLEEMPSGMGRMANMRTLSNFVLGRGKSKQMREFKELINLQGKLHISGLYNVRDAEDVVIGGFKMKGYIEELILDWTALRTTKKYVDLDEKVLDAIEAHKNLKSLTIEGYGGKRLSDWIVGVRPSFTAMISLRITDCFNCEALPSLGNLPFLKHLEMRSLDRLESIGEEFYGDSHYPFQVLEKLNIEDMKVLKTWSFPGGDKVAFKMLKDLHIESCNELTKIPYCFPSLTRLDISWCHNLVKFEKRGEAKEGSCSMTAYRHPFQSIYIGWCPKLEEIPNSFANSDSFEIKICRRLVHSLRLEHVRKLMLIDFVSSRVKAALQECRVEVVEELTVDSSLSDLYNWEIHRFTSLKRLKLIILREGRMDDVGEVRTLLPPNLSDLTIFGYVIRHANIENLIIEISDLHSLTKLNLYGLALESFPDVDLPSTVKSLTIEYCSTIRSIPDRFLSGCSKSLLVLRIVNCRNFECLPSTLSTLESLQIMHIISCGRIHQLPTTAKLSVLEILHIQECPSLSVTEDGLPTNLRRLVIIDCGKMKAIIKTVLPTLTFLTHLELEGFPDITTLDHCLPESIQTLTIRDFPRFKSLTGVLSSLKHLTRLTVQDCSLVDKNSWC